MLGTSRLWSAQGFFQAPKIIKHAEFLGFPERLQLKKRSSACIQVCTNLHANPTAGLHVRLQDFPLKDRLPPEYYLSALDKVFEQLPDVQQAVVFTDEPSAIGPYLGVLKPWKPQLVDTDGLTPPELLEAMTCTAAFVSCKSSLSFWAGYWCESRGGHWQSTEN